MSADPCRTRSSSSGRRTSPTTALPRPWRPREFHWCCRCRRRATRRKCRRERLLQFTEDDEGGWTKMFAVAKLPSAYLVNAKRQFVWKHEGGPNPAELAAAIDQHQVPTSEPRFRPLRLQLSRGDPPPETRALPLGSYALAVLAWYGLGRFFLEPLREHPDLVFGRIRINQIVAALLAIGAGCALIVLNWPI